ncbi:MAG: hypothetical protein AAF821_20180 [Cyanobacteria bacterium P01_D01_bin.156]
MTIKNQLRHDTAKLCKAISISLGLLMTSHMAVQAQTETYVGLNNDVINPAKLKDTTPQLAQERGVRGGDGTASDFVGLGISVGTGDGDGALEEVGLTVISKFSVAPQLAVRPSVIINDEVGVLAPITFNFQSPVDVLNASLYPYVGGGIAINATEDDVAPLVSAGVDIPFSERFTLNGQSNVTLADDITVHFMIGLGYNIDGLF